MGQVMSAIQGAYLERVYARSAREDQRLANAGTASDESSTSRPSTSAGGADKSPQVKLAGVDLGLSAQQLQNALTFKLWSDEEAAAEQMRAAVPKSRS